VSVREREQRDRLTRDQFLEIFHWHVESFYRFGQHMRRARHDQPKLTAAEEVEGARILSGKYTVGGNKVFFRTVREYATIEHKHQMKCAALLEKAEVTREYFGGKLVEKHPDITSFGKVDM
jgi:hypothetical protein